MKTHSVLVLDRDDLKNALADFFARVLDDIEITRQKILEGKLHSEIPDLTVASEEELIRHYYEFDLGYILLDDHPDCDTVVIGLWDDRWHVAAKRESQQPVESNQPEKPQQ